MEVSVRELKIHLSRYLRFVKAGHEILVTSRRVPLARILAVAPQEALEFPELLRSEGIAWKGGKPRGGKLRPKVRSRSAAERVLEDRG